MNLKDRAWFVFSVIILIFDVILIIYASFIHMSFIVPSINPQLITVMSLGTLVTILFIYFNVKTNYKDDKFQSWFLKPSLWFYFAISLTIGMLFLSPVIANSFFNDRGSTYSFQRSENGFSQIKCNDSKGFTTFVSNSKNNCIFQGFNVTWLRGKDKSLVEEEVNIRGETVSKTTLSFGSQIFNDSIEYHFSYFLNNPGDITKNFKFVSEDGKDTYIASNQITVYSEQDGNFQKQLRLSILAGLLLFTFGSIPSGVKAFRDLFEKNYKK
ncbi:MAG: hypothetical protein EPN86_00365 [Nanoarchaeota archaeon]|nr:MAG: hypothetical protein EPN86_00365 [Nanoarchaeota archaeon]